ncbi:uncharacterized protein LOC118202963 [Stegodyphus dumicola]|uniref:uncharacterized protein LOC118202963 n=1 Tax=Stegodyphus dumicola TaxID=202533 RepID=UPI0015AE45F0|nr:uncharacterized protein LOC118202963 [Stegodyphus dumicola]
MSQMEFNPVLMYKRQGEKYANVNENDFMLAIMTEFQKKKKMLIEFGNDRICIDSTHGISAYGFELVTLLVVDKYEEGIPVAFLISSTVSEKILVNFFNCIKKIIDIKPKVFMSDDAPMFYNAWEHTFGSCQKLLCAWHVDRAWKGHLNSVPKHKRQAVYKTLKTLMYELDEEMFNKMLETFSEQLCEDEDTREFHKYFMTYYFERAKMWAYCFRKGAKINTNMYVETFHRKLKYIYLDGKKTKRVDKCIIELINLVNDQKFDTYIKYQKGKITKKTTKTFQRHKAAELLNANCVKKDDVWEVSSELGENSYKIIRDHVCNDLCLITCRLCSCCLKAYKCTCHDYSILNNMCKHIHFVIMSEKKTEPYIGPLNRIPTRNNYESLTVSKTCISELIQSSFSISEKLNCIENMDINLATQIKKHLNAIEHLLEVPLLDKAHASISKEPTNKKIVPQKRFYSVKKRKVCKKVQFGNPSTAEKNNTKPILLNQLIVNSDPSYDHLYCSELNAKSLKEKSLNNV